MNSLPPPDCASYRRKRSRTLLFPPVMNAPTADSHSPRSMQPETFSPSAKPSTSRPSGFVVPCPSSTGTRDQASQERVTLYRRGVRDQAARNLDVVRQTHGYGRVPLLDVIAEQRRYIDIETGYTDILFDAYASRIALEKAVGTSLP